MKNYKINQILNTPFFDLPEKCQTMKNKQEIIRELEGLAQRAGSPIFKKKFPKRRNTIKVSTVYGVRRKRAVLRTFYESKYPIRLTALAIRARAIPTVFPSVRLFKKIAA